jgi:uncharacterized protein YciI
VQNAFGDHVPKPNSNEAPTPGDAPAPEGEGEKGKGGEGEGKGKTPTERISELSGLLGEYKQKELGWNETQKSKDENIRNMAKKIEALEKAAKGGKGEGEGAKPEALFKDVKRSKDLTAEQREEMTETEIKQMDSIADLQEGMNKMADLVAAGAKKPDEGDGGSALDVNGTVQDEAKKLAGNDTAMANQIIESFKLLGFNTTDMDEATLRARVATAAKEVSTYKPAKEQSAGVKGKPAGGTGEGDDPYGVDQIVQDASKSRESGGYGL